MNHRLAGIISPLGHITTDPIRSSSVNPSSPVYYKTIVNHFKSQTGIHVSPGLTNQEISAVESSHGFSFPLDLRSILQTGLPVGTNFPNWRTGSNRNNLLLPLLNLSQHVVRNGFWVDSWGIRPGNDAEALSLVKKLIEIAPVLVPVYGDFYVPSTTPNLAGNPVFQIDGDGVRELSCDVVGFLKGIGRSETPTEDRRRRRRPRRVEFWSDVAEGWRFVVARDYTRDWWSALGFEGLTACLDDAFWKLREAGWTEDDVRDMMMMDSVDQNTCIQQQTQTQSRDVVYAFGDEGMNERDRDTCTEDEDHQKGEVTTLRHLLLYDRLMS
ncbi:hypothetical protein AtNW77_Chr2g0241341 [Arabidopsis thaliana]|uniref:Uncharacterized protein n=3 Tax=Arabidopsis TaxID=3701 RepID=A0A178VXC4_ARATH|nr:hypothetical protein ISN45_At02g016640 [Arabidopsis thaliana x Arabidopsis arenosa]KAG7641716.1 hypothetical protein ISN44_As02g017100 [Arabidopsis suecica]OAP10486.1 hypothetical protein AXX17_AT2G18370 [Arabidopsis thaliana]CAA0369878.1 unnamed protein product [Arabidopsis thaliana]VYS53195.1 unnamed protein product [Arabidopsis thaliana]